MFNKLKMFLSKLTTLSKIILSILLIIIICLLTYFISSIRYINHNEILFNKNTGDLIDKQGITFKSRNTYYILNLNDKQINNTIEIQTSDLKIYTINYIIIYNYNKQYIKENKCIPTDFILNELEFNDYILNQTINLSINELIANNKKELKTIILNYFNLKINNSGYIIKNIWFNKPIK